MTDRYIFPIRITKYEASIREELSAIGDKLAFDEAVDRHSNNPEALREIESRLYSNDRTSIKPLSESDYLKMYDEFLRDTSGCSEKLEIFITSGYIVLTDVESKRLGLKKFTRKVNL